MIRIQPTLAAMALTLFGGAGAQAEAPVSVAVIPEVKLFADACLISPGDLAAAIAAFEAFGLTYRDDPAAESIGMYAFSRDEVNALFLSGGATTGPDAPPPEAGDRTYCAVSFPAEPSGVFPVAFREDLEARGWEDVSCAKLPRQRCRAMREVGPNCLSFTLDPREAKLDAVLEIRHETECPE